jgi:hypothetical protein
MPHACSGTQTKLKTTIRNRFLCLDYKRTKMRIFHKLTHFTHECMLNLLKMNTFVTPFNVLGYFPVSLKVRFVRFFEQRVPDLHIIYYTS